MSEVLTDKDLLKKGLYRYTDDPYNENPFYNNSLILKHTLNYTK